MHTTIHVLVRDEKEGRKKQARSNKKGTAHPRQTCTCVLKAGHPGVPSYYMFVCLGYGWVGYFTFLFFFKLVCYAHVFPCMYMYIYIFHSCLFDVIVGGLFRGVMLVFISPE